MNLPFFIARRYLFSKKSYNAINIISAISAMGVALAAMAMVVTLSVFNGFQDLVADLFTAFDPELKVIPAEGKHIRKQDRVVQLLAKDPDVAALTPVLEDQAMIVQGQEQVSVTIKGVADNWPLQADLQRILYPQMQRDIILHADVLEYGVLGIQLAARLGLNADFHDPLTLYAPRRGARVNMANPMTAFNQGELLSPGYVFMVQQSKYDANYIVTSLGFAQTLFDQKDRISQLEIKLKRADTMGNTQRRLQKRVGERFIVQNRYEQQEDVFRIMRIEKFIAYLFLSFILFIASFNIIGSLSMLMIDKQADVRTLTNLGATPRFIRRLFALEGIMISVLGAILGTLLGLLICYLQQTYGFVPMGREQGDFIIESYPVSVHPFDIALVLLTVIIVNALVIWLPVKRLSRRILQ